jgi:glycine betaine/proline transport system substrate-binding protein
MSLKNLVNIALVIAACILIAQPASACSNKRAIVIGDMDYDTAHFTATLISFILDKGYGCSIARRQGTTLELVELLGHGEIDLIPEIWIQNAAKNLKKMIEAGNIIKLGTVYPSAIEGWFVPRYLVEGPSPPAPNLRSVSDLAEYRQLFSDPEEPSRGRFLNCPIGWQCEFINTRKLKGYGLSKTFVNYRPSSGTLMELALVEALESKRPIVFYYWGPSWLIDTQRLRQLEEPPYNEAVWQELLATEYPTRATSYPRSEVAIAANANFANISVAELEFLKRLQLGEAALTEILPAMHGNTRGTDSLVRDFLVRHPEIWTNWVPANIAARITAYLTGSRSIIQRRGGRQ